MTTNFERVKVFMETFGQEVKSEIELPDKNTQKLRVRLIQEELTELIQALAVEDEIEVADALTDILYVTYGAGHAFGIDLDACFEEVLMLIYILMHQFIPCIINPQNSSKKKP
mgnify:CR=1 FL=1